MVATTAECCISTRDLPLYVLDSLFDSFGKETISDDDYFQNYDDVGKRSSETDHYSRISFINTRTPVMIKVTA